MSKNSLRRQAFVDTSIWLEWLVRRVSGLALALLAISIALNHKKPGIVWELGESLLALLIVNLGFTGMRWLAETLRS